MVMKTPMLESQTIPHKTHQTTRKVFWAFDLNSKSGKGRLTVEQKYMQHSNAEQRVYATKNAHDIRHSTNLPSVV
jgi:hypothetical protein